MFPELVLDAKNFIIIFVAILHAAVGFVVLVQGRAKLQNFIFSLIEFSLVLWAVSMVFFRSSFGSEIFIWTKFLYLSPLFIPYIFVYFTYSFPYNELKKIPKIFHFLLPLPVLFLLVNIISGKFVANVTLIASERIIIFSQGLVIFYAVYFAAYFIWSFLRLSNIYKHSSGVIKFQVRYVLIGTIISALAALTSNLFFPIFGIFTFHWFGQAVTIVMAAAIAYAIMRHNFLNIRVIAIELFSAIILILVLFRWVGSVSADEFLINGILFLGVAVFSALLIRSGFQEVRAREDIENLAENLKRANKELKKLDQLKSEFVSITSHQLRTPLAVVKGYISMIQEGTFGQIPEKLRGVLSKIYFSNERLINLVNDFLNLSRIESGKMIYEFESVSIAGVIENVVDEFGEIARSKKIELLWERPQQPLRPVYIDKEKFHQVISNLIDNSLKYTKEGYIKIEVSEKDDEISGKSVLVSVEDTGIGMSKEESEVVFRRFSRGEGEYRVNVSGLGLGLYLAKRIVGDHGGEIWASSGGLGQGSTFFIRLPLKADKNR